MLDQRASTTRPRLLIVEDDDPITRSLIRLLRTKFEIEVARTVAEVRALAAGASRFSGSILDITLPDGSALEILGELRDRGLAGPVLVLSGHFERSYVAKAQLHGAEYLPKPLKADHLAVFAQRVGAFARNDEPRALRFIERFAHRHKLTSRETEIVALAVASVPRAEMLVRMGITQDTLKTQIRALLRKSRERNLAELTQRIRREMRPTPE